MKHFDSLVLGLLVCLTPAGAKADSALRNGHAENTHTVTNSIDGGQIAGASAVKPVPSRLLVLGASLLGAAGVLRLKMRADGGDDDPIAA